VGDESGCAAVALASSASASSMAERCIRRGCDASARSRGGERGDASGSRPGGGAGGAVAGRLTLRVRRSSWDKRSTAPAAVPTAAPKRMPTALDGK
jgi:hypothetical protein